MELSFYFTLRVMENFEKLGFLNVINDLDLFYKDVDVLYHDYLEKEESKNQEQNYYNSINKYIENNKKFVVNTLKNSLIVKK